MANPWRTDLGLLPKRKSRTKKMATIDELFALLFESYGLAIFRGQANSDWPLQTRLERACPRQTLAHERRMMQIFKADAELSIGRQPNPEDDLNWMAVAQHHGAPTRLLDWSHSPFISLFFACADDPDVDGAIWLVDATWAARASFAVIHGECADVGDWNGPRQKAIDAVLSKRLPVLLPVSTRPRFPRLVAQAGHFTLVGGVDASADEALRELGSTTIGSHLPDGVGLRKAVIPSRLKPLILDRLSSMQITYATVYPDIEGLAKSLPKREWLDWQDD